MTKVQWAAFLRSPAMHGYSEKDAESVIARLWNCQTKDLNGRKLKSLGDVFEKKPADWSHHEQAVVLKARFLACGWTEEQWVAFAAPVVPEGDLRRMRYEGQTEFVARLKAQTEESEKAKPTTEGAKPTTETESGNEGDLF